jgi:integrase
MPRTPKGNVSLVDKDGWVQLRWRYQGKRYYLSLGLPYDPVNCRVAQQKANQIQLDILAGHFDTTLASYKPENQQVRHHSAVGVFQKFITFKKKRVQPRTLEKYYGLVTWLEEFYGGRPANTEDAEDFIQWLLENLEPVTAKERLGLLSAAWTWGIQKELVSENPWADLTVRNPPKQKPKPFTKDEVKAIVQAFHNHSRFRHYAQYVEFKFQTGCRTGEVNGLRWRHLNDDCSVVWLGETHTHGQFKDTKTSKAREVKLSPSSQQMLRSRRPEPLDEDALVFPAPEGGPMNERNFAKRAWKRILEQCGIDYRIPYNTAKSHQLRHLNRANFGT